MIRCSGTHETRANLEQTHSRASQTFCVGRETRYDKRRVSVFSRAACAAIFSMEHVSVFVVLLEA